MLGMRGDFEGLANHAGTRPLWIGPTLSPAPVGAQIYIYMGVDLHQKVGGPNRKIIGSKNLVFKTFKNVKSANFGVFNFFICPAIYSTNQI